MLFKGCHLLVSGSGKGNPSPACHAVLKSSPILDLSCCGIPWLTPVSLLEHSHLPSGPLSVDLVKSRLQNEISLQSMWREKCNTAFFFFFNLSLAFLRGHHVILDGIKRLEKKNEYGMPFSWASYFNDVRDNFQYNWCIQADFVQVVRAWLLKSTQRCSCTAFRGWVCENCAVLEGAASDVWTVLCFQWSGSKWNRTQ